MERWLRAQEMARRFGIGSKTLRHYEREGLLRPTRSEAGWRLYGPGEQARLHQILTLKQFGLGLRQIGALLNGERDSLATVLELQRRAAEARMEAAARAVALIRSAQAKLASLTGLDLDDLTRLTEETVMTKPADTRTRAGLIPPHIDRHFSKAEQAAFKDREKHVDPEAIARSWNDLIAEGRALQASGNPDSPESRAFAARWMAQVRSFTGDDPALIAKTAQVNIDALADPAASAHIPFDLDLMRFVSSAYRSAELRG